jgi:hypothetical protein
MNSINDEERPSNPRAQEIEVEEHEAKVKEFVKQRAEKERASQSRQSLKIKKPSDNRLEAVRYYRDVLHWDVLPLAAPAKGGKSPLIPGYKVRSCSEQTRSRSGRTTRVQPSRE